MRYLILFIIISLSYSLSYCQCDPSGIPNFSSEIIARSSGNDLDQPLISGEEVFIRISFNTNRDSFSRLMHGLIPTFGPGWDYNKIDIDVYHPVFGYHRPQWFSAHEDCPPFTKKDLPSLCTYYDINGILQLCNLNCETCPCTEGLITDDILPSGWFYNFAPANCFYTVDCPLTTSWAPWGVHISHNGWNITLDILLTVDTFSIIDSCETRKDLSIGIQEIYDDITGCWDAEQETVAVKFFTDDWSIDCTQPPITKTFNKVKFIIYHDENLDGIKNEDEVVINLLKNFDLIGESISGYSEQLQYYFVTGNEYQAVCDTNNFQYNYALSTQAIVDVNFNDGIKEKEVEFGVYMKPTSVNTAIQEKEIIAYPNPFTSNLSIQLPEGKHLIKLINIEGSVIYRIETNSQKHNINTNEFIAGIYYLSIYDEQSTMLNLQKIVKY